MKSMKSIVLSISLIATSLGWGATANASLIGDTVSFTRLFNGSDPIGFPVQAVVGAGVEFTDLTTITSDVGDSSIRLDIPSTSFSLGNPPQVYVWDSLDWINDPAAVITGISVSFGGSITRNAAGGGQPVFSAANASFTDHSVSLEVGGYAFTDAFVEIELQTSHAVSEPGTFAILGLGLAGLGLARRRKAA